MVISRTGNDEEDGRVGPLAAIKDVRNRRTLETNGSNIIQIRATNEDTGRIPNKRPGTTRPQTTAATRLRQLAAKADSAAVRDTKYDVPKVIDRDQASITAEQE